MIFHEIDMVFNENTRVKIPALIHLTRLGYVYLSLKDKSHIFDPETNIIIDIFIKHIQKLNSQVTEDSIAQELQNIREELNYDDLGRAFYKRLIGTGEGNLKLIEWEDFSNNSFHITTELANKNGEDEFRPDITIFINGLPLSFVEVKIPNNPEGIKAERDRVHMRFKNEKFRRFINITQLIVLIWSTTMLTQTNYKAHFMHQRQKIVILRLTTFVSKKSLILSIQSKISTKK